MLKNISPVQILRNALILAYGLFVCCSIFSSCDGTPVITSPEQIVFPSANVSFSRHIQPFFAVTCNGGACHNSRAQSGGVVLESYFDVVFTTPGLVRSGSPEQSRLIQVLDFTSRTRVNHIASFQTRITQNHIDGVKTWIREGAQ